MTDSNTRHTISPERAVIYVPKTITDPTEFAAYVAPCLERIDRCGYEFGGIVRSWREVAAMWRNGQAHIAVIASTQSLPPGAQPRVEVATDPIHAPPRQRDRRDQSQRRPRPV